MARAEGPPNRCDSAQGVRTQARSEYEVSHELVQKSGWRSGDQVGRREDAVRVRSRLPLMPPVPWEVRNRCSTADQMA